VRSREQTSKVLLVPAIVLIAVTGCGSNGNASAPDPSARVERCVDRLVSRAESGPGDEESARAYVRTTYCERFERNGWVYEDGALSIAAQEWLDEAGTCAVGGEDEPTRTAPCEEVEDRRRFNCALLHHVRRSEVRGYVEARRREGPFTCDDGTRVEELGAP
jgi:hypothetical protein